MSSKGTRMSRTLISSGSPFEEKIAYSRAVVVDGWVFVSGTTGYDYATMSMPEGVADQCRNTLGTIAKALAEAGGLDGRCRPRALYSARWRGLRGLLAGPARGVRRCASRRHDD